LTDRRKCLEKKTGSIFQKDLLLKSARRNAGAMHSMKDAQWHQIIKMRKAMPTMFARVLDDWVVQGIAQK
jgi:hypothetical protein